MNKFQIKISDPVIVCGEKNPGKNALYYTWPALTLLKNGDILCCARKGSGKVSADGRTVLYRSSDGGSTWVEDLSPVYDDYMCNPLYEFRVCGITELAENELIAVYVRFYRGVNQVELFSSVDDGLTSAPETRIVKSYDNGLTWGEPVDIDLSIDNYSGVVVIDDGFLALQDGTLVLPVETWRLTGKPFKPGDAQHSRVCISYDDGYSWSDNIINAGDPNGNVSYYDQRICEMPNGGILSTIWTHDYRNHLDLTVHMVYSYNKGKSWSKPKETNLTGQITCPVSICGDAVLAIYNCRTAHLGKGVKVVISYDRGVTWDIENEVTLWSPVPPPNAENRDTITYSDIDNFNFGNPDIIKLSDTEFLAAFYHDNGKTTTISAVRVSLLTDE